MITRVVQIHGLARRCSDLRFRGLTSSSCYLFEHDVPPSFHGLPSKVASEDKGRRFNMRRSIHISALRLQSSNPAPPSQSADVDSDSGRYKIVTVPNVLCIARIGVTPVIGYLVIGEQFLPAFSLFVAAGFTDLLDGWIARNVPGQMSLLGSVLDPLADKLLISTLFVTMASAGLLPIPLTAVVILRDVCLITGGFYKRYQTMQPPYSLKRFFNPTVSSMQVVPTLVSKINTVLQLTVVAAALACPVFQFGEFTQTAIHSLCWITAGTTVYSGLQYAYGGAFKKIK